MADIAARHGISSDAALHMLVAVSAGHGAQAQFNHPELGGMGQWSRGGMTMVGDMFNDGLKARVDTLCTELSGIVQQHRLFAVPVSSQSQSQGGPPDLSGVSLFAQESSDWPADLGQPSSAGAQNDLRYAYFPDKRRLAVKVGGQTTVYDTGDHRISGFGQAQGGGRASASPASAASSRFRSCRSSMARHPRRETARPGLQRRRLLPLRPLHRVLNRKHNRRMMSWPPRTAAMTRSSAGYNGSPACSRRASSPRKSTKRRKPNFWRACSAPYRTDTRRSGQALFGRDPMDRRSEPCAQLERQGPACVSPSTSR